MLNIIQLPEWPPLIHTMVLVSYLLLAISLLCTWLPQHPRRWMIITALMALCTASLCDTILTTGVATLLVLLGLAILSVKFSRYRQILLISIFSLLAIALSLHVLPGFNNLAVIEHQQLKPDSAFFSLWLNFDKPWIAWIILFVFKPALLRNLNQWRTALVKAWLPLLTTLTLTMLLAANVGLIHWLPAVPPYAMTFLAINLIFTCVAEECFFRIVVQNQLYERLRHLRHGEVPAIVTTGCLFGLTHAGGGGSYIAVATVAGVGYAWVYQRSGSLEMAILAHWLLNTLHFIGFTYPVAV